ncbi:MAG: adenylyltransferase/cytidyltransferase family protein [Rhodospirillaceae bacterium]|nr:adenylyltransferase/cytidyltransferase family protein [Rhodospirillaceae bacterium]
MDAGKPARSARAKIQTIDELAKIAAEARASGSQVVLAHGVFDLVHVGHIRHLESARRQGDVLIVTVTADAFVNKGPGRPAFTDALRAEMLGALEYVDWVGVNHASDAMSAIQAIKPDAYVKGSDYADSAADVTGKIAEERKAVEAHGGRLVFTDEITSSSTQLINQYFSTLDPAIRDYLDNFRREYPIEAIENLLEQVRDYRVLVIGDAIIDEYQYVVPMGKSPKENMIATQFQNREIFAGGVVAAANHLANFCAEVDVITAIGSEDSNEELLLRSRQDNVEIDLIERRGMPTTRKCRFIDPGYMRKLFEVYEMDDTPLDAALEAELNNKIASRIGDYDMVLITDFGHGLIGRSTIDLVSKKSKFLAVNAQSNSANMGFNLITRYSRADYLCIDTPEARLATGEKRVEVETIAGEILPSMVKCDKLILTHGKYGCVTYAKGEPVSRIPALTRTVVDTVGAGDAFLAVTAPLVCAGGPMKMIGFVGNVVGALKVAIMGHRSSVDKPAVVKSIRALLG